MRPVYCALSILLSVCAAYPSVDVTVVLQFDDRYSELSIGEMKTKLKRWSETLAWCSVGAASISSLRPQPFPGWL